MKNVTNLKNVAEKYQWCVQKANQHKLTSFLEEKSTSILVKSFLKGIVRELNQRNAGEKDCCQYNTNLH